jgi:hypothetical protein
MIYFIYKYVPQVTPPSFLSQLRAALKRIKQDPYPSVSIFGSNQPRLYRKDDLTGHWVRYGKEATAPPADSWAGPSPPTPQHHSFKQEPVPAWPALAVQPQLYY